MRLNHLLNSDIIIGIIDIKSTLPQSDKDKGDTLNASAKNGTLMTMTCKNMPTTIDPSKNLFENKPILKIDFSKCLMESEYKSCETANTTNAMVLACIKTSCGKFFSVISKPAL